MSDELNTKGKFFLREEPEKECYGALYLSEGFITLDLLEGLTDLQLKKTKTRKIYRSGNKPEYEKVFGMTNAGAVALIKRHFGRSQHWNYLSETSEKFSIAFVGEEDFSDTGEISFKEIVLSYTGLKTFVGKSNIVQKVQTKKDPQGKETFKEINILASIENRILKHFSTKDYDISFEASYNWSVSSDDPVTNEHHINETPHIRIRKKVGTMSIEEVRILTFSFRDFLAFALRDKTFLIESYGFNESEDSNRLKTQIFYSQYDPKEQHRFDYYMPLFLSNDFEEELGDILDLWFLAYKDSPVLYHNYFKYLFLVSNYWESSILSLILGVENYIDLNIKKEIQKDKKNEIQEEEITQAMELIDEVSNKFLQKYLIDRTKAFVNEVGFQRKFKSLYSYLPEGLTSRINLQKDMKLISKARHAIAHGGVTGKLQKEVDQNRILTKLLLLNEYCLLKTIGVKEKKISELLTKMHPY